MSGIEPARRFRANSQEPVPRPQSGRAPLFPRDRFAPVSIVNRRNAVMGWLAWSVAKSAMRWKAAQAGPAAAAASRDRRLRAAGAFTLAAGAGLFTFLRMRGQEDDS